jgi:hypothetical protein
MLIFASNRAKKMILLPTAYLGNIHYYSKLLFGQSAVIDTGEHYRKQSFRNRCEILGANGVIALSVPVLKRSGEKTPVHAVRIDPSKAWRHQHWHSIHSAYRNSPYFDHFAERFEAFYRKDYDLLWEWNRDLQACVLEALKVDIDVPYSDRYIEPLPADADWRDGLSDKPRLRKADPGFRPAPYDQVFYSGTQGVFQPNLSILDLLFCEGRGAVEVIRRSVIPAAGTAR